MKFKCLFFLLCTIPTFIYSQGFRYLDVNDGLSSNQVFQVEKDSTGFMWFVTYMGIDRFDGSQIKHYKLKVDSTEYENYPSYTRMFLNNNGEILIALQGGKIFHYNKFLDDFELNFDVKKKINYRDFILLSAYFDTNDQLWIISNYGLYVFNTQTDDFRSLFIFDNELPSCVTEDGEGHFYVGTDKHLYELTRKITGGFTVLKKIDFKEPYGKITCLFRKDQKVYIGTELKGAYVFDTNTDQLISLFPEVPHVVICSLNYAADNKIIIGTDGSGIYIIDSDTGTLRSHFDSDYNLGNGLTSNSIYDVTVDENNYIWITTYANGVNIIVPLLFDVSLYKHIYNEPNSLVNNQVNAVLEDTDGDLWIGTNNGVSCFHAETKQWKHYLTNEKRKAVIISLNEDNRKNIWAGTYGMGAFRIEKKSGKIVNYQRDKQNPRASINTNYIYSIYTDKNDNVWIGGLWGKLTRYNTRENTFQYYDIETLGKIRPLNDKTLLIGTSVGFSILDVETSHFKEYSAFGGKSTKNAVRSFYVADEEEVWLGTEGGGLVRFNPRTESFQRYTTSQGLSSNYIYSIEGDRNGNIWITTEREILRFNPRTGQFFNISGYLGLDNFSFTPYTSIRRQNDDLVFGTIDGALELPANKISNVDVKAKLIFTDFRLFYNSVNIGGDNALLKKAINETNLLSLTYKQNSFSFAFSAINYRSQRQIVYAYMLENFDDKWYTVTNNNNTVSYTNIGSGDYLFRLRALNKDTGALIDERSIAIQISPPFWKSIYAWILYFILFLIILKLAVQYVKNSIEKRYTKEKIQFFVNMAHDIRTPVSLIKAPLNDLSENENLTEKGKMVLDIAIRNTEKLVLMITQLLDFQKADMSLLRLIVSKYELKEYILERILFCKIEAERKNITLIPEINFGHLHVWFDREKMDKIINNLLSNAIKYSPKGGKVTVRVSQDQNCWYLSVIDSGVGIPQSEQKYLFRRFFRARNAINSKETGSGIGLMLTKELVKLHEGSITFSSKENVGTEFKLSFKKGEDFFRKKEMLKAYVIEEDNQSEDREAEVFEPDTDVAIQGENKKNIRLLIVEDNNDMRLYLKNHLSKYYNILEATDGQEALDIIREMHPDFIISDNLMPKLNGDEMCARLKGSMETSHIPIILLTALTDKENILKGLDCGADDYITKPFDIAILKAKIRNRLQYRENLKTILTSSDNSNKDPEYANPLDKEFIEKTIRIIEDHLDDPAFSMNNFYLAMGMSRSTFYNKLKALTGQGPNTFIRIIRLNKAKELLLKGQYNVFEVSIMTGFTDSKYFSTVFKKQFGVSPSKIKK